MKNGLALPGLWLGLSTISACAVGFIFVPINRQFKQYPLKILVVGIFFIMAVLSLYLYWGKPSELAHYAALQKVTHALKKMSTITQKEAILAQFATLEDEVAHSHVAIAYVGNLYSELGLFERSIKAYEKALEMAPEQKEYRLQWIYNHSRAGQGKLPVTVREFAQEWIKVEPSHKELINFLALDDYHQQHYEEALQKWQWLLVHDQQLTAAKKAVLRKAIYRAQQQMRPSCANIILRIRVRLAADLLARQDPRHTVFVYVKEPTGSWPVVVAKRLVADLPFIIDLEDKHSMLPTQRLCHLQQAQVVAKISPSGDPLDKKDDLRGTSPVIMIESGIHQVEVVISEPGG